MGERMTFLSLFAGIGGLDLGLERAGMRCVGQVEIDPYCRAVLAKNWPDVPRWDDVRTFGKDTFDGSAELICGGFPCQDLSVAGKGKQLEGARSGLWWEFHRIIGELRPAWVLAENVPALRNRGADDVLSSLEALGYAAWPLVVGAWAVGAPHKRDRVWIVAHAARDGERGQPATERTNGERVGATGDDNLAHASLQPEREPEHEARTEPRGHARANTRGRRSTLANPLGGDGGSGLSVAQREAQGRTAVGGAGARSAGVGQADTQRTGLEGQRADAGQAQRPEPRHGLSPAWPARPGEPQHDWEAPRLTQFGMGQSTDGISVRLVRFANRSALKALGNAVVPANAEVIGRLILQAHEEVA